MIGSITPCSSDGKPIFLPSLLPKDAASNFTGAGDNVGEGVRFAGTKLSAHSIAAGITVVTFQFIEWVYVLGGLLKWNGASIGDEVSADTFAPATVGTSNPGHGNYNKVAVGPARSIFVPSVPGMGNWDLNLTEKYNSKVKFSKVVPVPTYAGNGYFDWDADTEAVTLNVDASGKGHGGFNLFDFELRVNRFLNAIQLLGNGQENFPADYASPKKILAHWITRLYVTNSINKPLDVTCTLAIARTFTT